MKKSGRVTYSFTPRFPDELQIFFNTIVTILSEESEAGSEWLEVECNGATGKVPRSYVEQIELFGAEAKVLFDFTPEDNSGQYLKLEKGETITILNYDSSGWDVGYSSKDNKVGAIPHNYIKILQPVGSAEIKEVPFSPPSE